jgi:hypothetical protein
MCELPPERGQRLRAHGLSARRALQGDGDVDPVREAMASGELDHLLRDPGHRFALAPLKMHPSRERQRDGGRQRMVELGREPLRGLDRNERLVGIAEQPLIRRELVARAGAGVVSAVEQGLISVSLSVVEREAALAVGGAHNRPAHAVAVEHSA